MVHHNLTEGEITLVRAAWAPVAQDFKGAGKMFYDVYLKDYPEVIAHFEGVNMDNQPERVMRFVHHTLALIDQPDQLEFTLQCCGQRHAGYGLEAEHFDGHGKTLMKIMGMALQDKFTPEVEAAWKKYYAYMASEMTAGTTDETGKVLRARYEATKKQ